MAVITITKENFETEVIKSDKPILLDFWAGWCGPCRQVSPVIDEIAEEIPVEFYHKLNGGILLLPDTKMSPYARNNDLYIMGEYCFNQQGRYINIYYGSVMKAHAWLDAGEMRDVLKKLLIHEFTHHIESLAGEKGLVDKDIKKINDYLNN